MFPFKVSPADQLRRLFQHDRLKDQANSLGLSSISPGEGSLDLWDASGNAVAVYGDLPGGGFGIGVKDGASIVDIRTLFGRASDVTALQGRVSTAEGNISSVSAEVSGARGGFANLNARLNDHATRVGAAEGKLTTQAGQISSLQTSTGSLSSEVATARGGFASLGTRLSDHASRLGASENEITAIRLSANVLLARVVAVEALASKIERFVKGTHPNYPNVIAP